MCCPFTVLLGFDRPTGVRQFSKPGNVGCRAMSEHLNAEHAEPTGRAGQRDLGGDLLERAVGQDMGFLGCDLLDQIEPIEMPKHALRKCV